MTNNKSARDWAIFRNINYERYSDVERMTAIEHIAYAPTHNSITKAMMLDVIRYLLTAQQPRVLTLEEVRKLQSLRDGAIWLEVGKGMFPALPEMAMPELMFFIAIPPTNYKTYCEWEWYNKTWRCWSAQPTEEQREATPWDEPPKESDPE